MKSLPIRDILKKINNEDAKVASKIKSELKAIEVVADAFFKTIEQGGHVYYVGSGTSGRMGVLDAAELPPTFGVKKTLVKALIAGGKKALISAIEGSEDDLNQVKRDILHLHLSPDDMMIGIAASGRTPYTIQMLKVAKKAEMKTALISNMLPRPNYSFVDHHICVAVGKEVIEGSTRMKAGTAQKMILNMLSTAVMIKLGRTYHGKMVSLEMNNEKLKKRALSILMDICQISRAKAISLMKQAKSDLKVATVMYKCHMNPSDARKLLLQHKGDLDHALSYQAC